MESLPYIVPIVTMNIEATLFLIRGLYIYNYIFDSGHIMCGICINYGYGFGINYMGLLYMGWSLPAVLS